jgi:hypothetical protein
VSVWAPPAANDRIEAPAVDDTGPLRWRYDVRVAGVVVAACVLLGAPAGLLWSAVAPRLQVTLTDQGPQVPSLESSKAFVGADGSYLVVMAVLGLLCGTLAWFLARRSGPWTVVALVVGGTFAALIAATVGLRPGAQHAIAALREGSTIRGHVELFLGRRTGTDVTLRAPWAAVAWPVGALTAFLSFALRRPEELD